MPNGRCCYGCTPARLYACGWRCAAHAPSAPPEPDPAATLDALRTAAGIRTDTAPTRTTLIDRRNSNGGRRT